MQFNGFDKFAGLFTGVAMLLYGSLLLHHSNTLIRKRFEKNEKTCKVSDNILLAQGVAIILVALAVFVINNAIYDHFPSFYQKLNYLGDVHTKYGGHNFSKYIKMMIVLGFSIYFLTDIESHKKCVKVGGGVGGEGLLVAANIIIISLIGLFLLYKGVQMGKRIRMESQPYHKRGVRAFPKPKRKKPDEYGGMFDHGNPKFSMGRRRRGGY